MQTPVVHFYYTGIPFEMPRYCRPMLVPRQSTKDARQVTCRDCLKKLARLQENTGAEKGHAR